MRFTLQLVIEDDKGSHQVIEEIIQLDKDCHDDSMIGLSLVESKALLKILQKQLIAYQAKARLSTKNHCPCCHKLLKLKDHHSVQYRTPFGIVQLQSPRLFHCHCS